MRFFGCSIGAIEHRASIKWRKNVIRKSLNTKKCSSQDTYLRKIDLKKVKKEDDAKLIKQALIRKALGYEAKESSEEYSLDKEGNEVLTKRKVSKKYFPPDMTALKLLVEKFYPDLNIDISMMSDEELIEERERILQMLKEQE